MLMQRSKNMRLRLEMLNRNCLSQTGRYFAKIVSMKCKVRMLIDPRFGARNYLGDSLTMVLS